MKVFVGSAREVNRFFWLRRGQHVLPSISSFRLISTSGVTKSDFDFEKVFKTGKPPEFFNFAADVFDSHVVKSPSQLALWIDNDQHSKQWSFAQLRAESVRAAIGLQRAFNPNVHSTTLKYRRIPPTTTIFVLLPRVPEFWFIALATIRLGIILSPGTTQLTPEDIAYRLKVSKPGFVVTDDEELWKIEEAQRLNSAEQLPKPIKVIIPRKRRREHITAENWLHYDDMVEDIDDSDIIDFRNVETKSSEISHVFYTSGTTGKPKRVAHSHASYGIGHYQTARVVTLKPKDLYWNISDVGWAKAFYGNFFAPWIAGAGVYVHQMDRFEVKKVLELLRTRPITGLCAPPTFFRAMVQETDPELFKFMSLQYAVSGGEAINPEVVRAWKKKSGVDIQGIYGQTETTAVVGYEEGDKRKENSMGLSKFGYDIRITDDDGVEVARGTEGNIAIKVKPQRPIGLFKGYLKDDGDGLEIDEEKSVAGDFYLTGDRGIMDEEGHMFYVGRSDDVIISAGYRIGPFEVESVLQQHPAVAENAVVPSPHSVRGHVVKAFIILAKDYKTKDPEELISDIQKFCKTHTAPYKYPRQIEFVDELPKNVSGKILRRELRKLEELKYQEETKA